ncbi:MAG: phosphoribosyltransferase family protein [Porticoccaceae bacterium]
MTEITKHFISANELLNDAFQLAALVEQSAYIPDLVLGIWRGGGPIAVAVHEFFHFKGHQVDHLPLRISSYTGIEEQAEDIELHGLEHLLGRLLNSPAKIQRVLIVDDVFDTGRSLAALLATLLSELKSQQQALHPDQSLPEVRIACPWYKPKNNQTSLVPDYYLHETDDWLVFPHELMGLTEDEIKAGKSAALIENLNIKNSPT